MPVCPSERELATVLATLRSWQHGLTEVDNALISAEHFDLTITPLIVEEIDELCERLNFPSE